MKLKFLKVLKETYIPVLIVIAFLMVSMVFKSDETLSKSEIEAIDNYKKIIEQNQQTIERGDIDHQIKIDGKKVYLYSESGQVLLETTVNDWEENKDSYIKDLNLLK